MRAQAARQAVRPSARARSSSGPATGRNTSRKTSWRTSTTPARRQGGAPAVKAFKGEEAFTSAILDVTEKTVSKIYFSSGHGEAKLDSAERGRGFGQLKQLLERANLTVGDWRLARQGHLPADAERHRRRGSRGGLPAAGASGAAEVRAGRRAHPPDARSGPPRARAAPADLGFGGFLSTYGLTLGNDIVIDPANARADGGPGDCSSRTVTAPTRSCGRSRRKRCRWSSRSPARSPSPRSRRTAYVETMLVETSKDGWGETSPRRSSRPVKKDPDDTPGPVTIARRGRVRRTTKTRTRTRLRRRRPNPSASSSSATRASPANGTIGNGGNANLRR